MEQRVVTVVGGTGFVGRNIVKQLAKEGFTVQVIARNAPNAKYLKPLGNVGQIVLVRGDVSDPQSYQARLRGSYAVINATGILFETGKQRFTAVHAEGPAKLAQAAKQQGVERFIHISALGIDKSESSQYAASKRKGEQAIRQVFPEATILRPSVIFGPEDNFYNQFASMAGLSPALPAIGGGKTRFQPVYVGDVAKAALACLVRRDTAGQTYELGGPNVYSFREILRYIMKVTGKKRCLAPVPYSVAPMIGMVSETLPKIPGVNLVFRKPLLTRDQVKLLKTDNVVSENSKGFAQLGITPTAVEMIVPEYLGRHKRAEPHHYQTAA